MGLLLVKVLCCLIHIAMGSSSAILFFSNVTHILITDIRNRYAEKSWEVFNKFLEQTPPLNGLLLRSFGSYSGFSYLLLCFFPHFSWWIGGKIGFYYKEHEILPRLPGKIWTKARSIFVQYMPIRLEEWYSYNYFTTNQCDGVTSKSIDPFLFEF